MTITNEQRIEVITQYLTKEKQNDDIDDGNCH